MPSTEAQGERREKDGVFINCPFDEKFRPMFDAIVFAVHDCGFRPRCTLENVDSGDTRITKIIQLLKSCRYSIHDISRTQISAENRLPRFNMPLELGLDLGLRYSENLAWGQKKCVVLDRIQYRYQKFISDIAGQDIRSHGNDPSRVIRVVLDWLRTASERASIPGDTDILRRYRRFQRDLPRIIKTAGLRKATLGFVDYSNMAAVWLEQRH